ncbi:TrmH family RNA methyltransferase [Peptostreptococcus faecalis]|uniref:TrmH family RNA methyltransferase n=1 Tax=Peptostreptococcus faecalis TaxID=2045015 RepID=UPI000C7D298E|nr:RNA methyltransferase [Peptostreptococcus faecalis]
MKHIKSKENNTYKFTKSLLKSKCRQKEKKYLVEGIRSAELAVENDMQVDYMVVSESLSKDETKRDILNKLEEKNDMYVFSDELFKNIVDTENSQGIVAILKMSDVSIDDADFEKYKRIIILDRVQDPGNMGTIIRTADAAGFDLVITTKGSVDHYNPKVVRSAMGSLSHIDITNAQDSEILEALRKNTFKIISSSLNTDKDYNSIDYGEKCAIVVGNEANGISEFWEKNSEILVKIPMYGKAESLNVAISAALLMYRARN